MNFFLLCKLFFWFMFHFPGLTNKCSMDRKLNPSALPQHMLSGFESYSIETLCTLGKEFVLELMTRMLTIVSNLKMDIKGDNKKDLDIVRIQLDYSRLIFLCLAEVRLRVDLKLAERIGEGHCLRDARPSDERLLDLLSEPNQPMEGAEKATLAEKFEQNRSELIRLNCQLKKLDWLSINAENGDKQ